MIPRISLPGQSAGWQIELARAIRDPAELLALLALPEDLLPAAKASAELFPLRVPRGFVARMEKGVVDDPLLRQVLPLGDEDTPAAGFGLDPVGDLDAMAAPGVLHKYQGRALIVATGACAVHCRYCFRRHFPYTEYNPGAGRWQPALDYLAANPSIKEVILSGGDPLSLSDEKLARLVEKFHTIEHLRYLRIHTRLPVVLPERVDDALLGWLATTRLKTVVVIHANHPREIDGTVAAAMARLKQVSVTLLNQAVLLRGVNDSAETLARLSERLFDAGVMPYYLHMLDKVAGAAHFEVDEDRARTLLTALRCQLPGYLVPRLVREQQGHPYKRPLT